MTILFQSPQLIPIPQDYQPLTTYFYPELTPPQENVPWHLLAQKCGPQYQTILSLQSLLLSNGNWRNTSYMKKVHNYEFYQHFTYLEQNTFSSSILYIVFTFVYICFFVFSLACAYHFFSGMKVHSIVFSVLLCFFCTSLIRFCYFFSFFSFYILFTHLHNHIKFLKSISIHSSV